MNRESKIWFTSDTHFCHENILRTRPQFSSLEEMTEVIVDNWNERVKGSDRVVHLGDFALSWGKSKSWDPIRKILLRLNGNKDLVCGNHDRKEVTQQAAWNTVSHYSELKLDLGGKHKQRIVLSHYALRAWNQQHRGSWMLHGHSHGNLPDIGGKIVDIGVDPRGFAPMSLDEIAEEMAGRPVVTPGDHHK